MPPLPEPVAAARLCPAAERDTPEDNVRSLAWSIAATIGGAVQPVTPAKQTLIMRRLYAGSPRPGPGGGAVQFAREHGGERGRVGGPRVRRGAGVLLCLLSQQLQILRADELPHGRHA